MDVLVGTGSVAIVAVTSIGGARAVHRTTATGVAVVAFTSPFVLEQQEFLQFSVAAGITSYRWWVSGTRYSN